MYVDCFIHSGWLDGWDRIGTQLPFQLWLWQTFSRDQERERDVDGDRERERERERERAARTKRISLLIDRVWPRRPRTLSIIIIYGAPVYDETIDDRKKMTRGQYAENVIPHRQGRIQEDSRNVCSVDLTVATCHVLTPKSTSTVHLCNPFCCMGQRRWRQGHQETWGVSLTVSETTTLCQLAGPHH